MGCARRPLGQERQQQAHRGAVAHRGRRQFGPVYHRPWQPTECDHDAWRQQAAACRAAWDEKWKAFIRCSADPIEVVRCLQIGNETDWRNLYAQFVCTAPPRTEVAAV